MSESNSAAISLAPAASLFRRLSELAEAGFTAAEAVAALKEDEDSGAASFAGAVAAIERGVSGQDTLAAALARHPEALGRETAALIQAAAERDALPQCLTLLADDYENRLQVRKGLVMVLFWPLFLLGFLVLIVGIVGILVLPAFKQVFASFGADLPGPTLALIAVSDVMVDYWWIVIPLAVAAPFAIAYLRRRQRAGIVIDEIVLKLPGVHRFIVKLLAGRTATLLAGAAASNLPVAPVVSYLRSTLRNRYLRSVVAGLEDDLVRGVALPDAWRKQTLLPRGFAHMVDVGQRSNRLAAVLGRVAQRYALEAGQAAGVFRQVLLVSTYILVAVIVGISVIAMYLPIFKMGSVI